MTEETFSPEKTTSPLQCRLCGHPHRPVPLRGGERAHCAQCGSLLAKGQRLGRRGALAFTLAGAIFALAAVSLPFVTVDRLQKERVGYLFTGVEMLWSEGMRVLSLAVLLCGILAPLLLLTFLGLLLVPRRGFWRDKAHRTLLRVAEVLEHWSMPEVHVLAVLVALTKLGTLVNVQVGPAFWCYGAMTVCIIAAWRNTALAPDDLPPIRHSRRHSTRRCAALALAATVMLIPANALPILNTSTRGIERTDTVISGISQLWSDGLFVIAAIVFAASILIPCLKLLGLGWLLLAAKSGGSPRRIGLTRLYSVLEFIGRWSMLDVFLVAFLAGLVQFGGLSSIQPRPGIVAFAAAVVLTVLATDAFDPRLLWQSAPRKSPIIPAK